MANYASVAAVNSLNGNFALHSWTPYWGSDMTPVRNTDSEYAVQEMTIDDPTDYSDVQNGSKSAEIRGLMNFLSSSLMIGFIVSHIAMSGAMTYAGKKRKRRNVRMGDMFRPKSSLFYKILNDLDQDNCIANAVCNATSSEITVGDKKHKLLLALEIDKQHPVPWIEMNTNKGKYQYAAFIGSHLNFSLPYEACKLVFSNAICHVEDVLNLLTSEITSCDQMMASLETLWPVKFNTRAFQRGDSPFKLPV